MVAPCLILSIYKLIFLITEPAWGFDGLRAAQPSGCPTLGVPAAVEGHRFTSGVAAVARQAVPPR